MTTWSVSRPVESSNLRTRKLKKLQHQIAEEHGYELAEHSLILYVKPKQH